VGGDKEGRPDSGYEIFLLDWTLILISQNSQKAAGCARNFLQILIISMLTNGMMISL
jgi:hypothetical protein